MRGNLTAITILAAVTFAQQINAATGQLHSDDRKAKVLGRIEEILDQWEKARPGSIGNLSQSQEDALANSLAKSLDPTASFQPADTAPIPTSDAQPISKPQPAVIIASQRVLYIRLDDISDTAADSIHADLAMAANLANKPLGIILDLRNASGSSAQAAAKAAASFVRPEDSPPTLRHWAAGDFTAPTAVLTSMKTSGAGELLAACVSNWRKAIRLGAASSGTPGVTRPSTLADGAMLHIPSTPDWLPKGLCFPLAPDLAVEPFPPISQEALRSTADAERTDQCLSEAVDLLVSLDMIRNKRDAYDGHIPME